MRPDTLVPANPDSTTSSIEALTRRFASNFGSNLALIGAFRAFSTIETFFFDMVPTDFAYAVDDFFATGLAFLRSTTN